MTEQISSAATNPTITIVLKSTIFVGIHDSWAHYKDYDGKKTEIDLGFYDLAMVEDDFHLYRRRAEPRKITFTMSRHSDWDRPTRQEDEPITDAEREILRIWFEDDLPLHLWTDRTPHSMTGDDEATIRRLLAKLGVLHMLEARSR